MPRPKPCPRTHARPESTRSPAAANGNWPLLSPETPQHLAVELDRQALPLRIRPRPVRARLDTELALLTDVPVLPVGHVPELDAVIRVEGGVAQGGRVEEPRAADEGAVRPARPQGVEHHVVRM